jgi:hypothetical protein
VNVGTNAGPCVSGSQNCQTNTAGDAYGVMSGYNAAAGYDMATGLGSVNANNLVNAWSTVATLPSVTTLSNVSPTTITHGQPVSFTATVAPQSGTGTPTGLVSLESGLTTGTIGVAGFNLSNGSVTGSTEMLPGGTYSLTAYYPGDSTYAPSTSSPISVTVNKENSQSQAYLVTFNSNGTILNSNTNTAVYGSLYLLRVNVDNSAGKLCAPAASTGATACPTGTVALTNNGSTLDAGSYTLNSYGYVEDQTAQLPGGADSVKAAYSGDNSFNASSATSAITITPAVSELNAPTVPTYSIGSAFNANAMVQSLSSGAAPTGTITFLLNGTPMAGTTSYTSGTGSGSTPVAFLTASFSASPSGITAPGSYSITASYSGDGNYTPVTSSPTQIMVQYPQPLINMSPTSQNVNVGATATVTAVVDAMNKTFYPTGTVTFTVSSTGALLGGPTTCTNTKDSAGNYACQASVSFTATAGILVVAQYSGDTNYPAATGNPAYVNVNDFTIGVNANSIAIGQGQAQTIGVNIGQLGAFNGTVSFTCSGLPAETSCSFNPATVTGGSGSTTLTITTTPLGQSRKRASNDGMPLRWGAAGWLFLMGTCLLSVPASLRKRSPTLLITLAILAALPSCGGGGSTPPPNNPVPSIASLSPTQMAAGSVGQNLIINGSGFIGSSSVTYNGTAHVSTLLSASQLSLALSASDVGTTGTYAVVVTNPAPGGGASSAVNFSVVTGTPAGSFPVTVTGTSGPLTHSTTFSLVVQ